MFTSTRKFNLMAIGQTQDPIVMTLFATEREKALCKKYFRASGIARPNRWSNAYEMTLYTIFGVFVYKYNVTYHIPEK